MEVLTRLVGLQEAQHQLMQILEADALERNVVGNQFSALFKNGPTQNFRRLCLACGVMIMHQLGGINSVTYYLPTLLQTFLGTGHRQTLWIAGLSSVDSMICALVPVLTIDKVGRRPFLFYGSIFQVIMFVIIASLLGTSPAGDYTYGTAAVVMLFIYVGRIVP